MSALHSALTTASPRSPIRASTFDPDANSGVMKFTAIDKTHRPGYYNATEASWGGIPIKGPDGKFNLIHAQMANHCPLGSWTTASMVARSTADTILGPYTFVEEVIPPFAHNPTVRQMASGEYVIWFIGGWRDVNPPPQCKGPHDSAGLQTYSHWGLNTGEFLQPNPTHYFTAAHSPRAQSLDPIDTCGSSA